MTKMVLARVTSKFGLFINSALHQPGELVRVDLDELGIDSLDDSESLEEVKEGDEQPISTAAIASVAPRAPGADMPQGLPGGTVQGSTGRFLQPNAAGENAGSTEIRPDTTEAELEAEPPVRRDTDIKPVDDAAAGKPAGKAK